jgi:glycosyltransferase involved in cell wall biosynthesis
MPTFNKIAFIGNYLPRQCGIATFTSDLCEEFALQNPDIDCMAVAMNDPAEVYDYPQRVRFELDQEDFKSYQSAADYLNMIAVDLVCLQHEFGIFGGSRGSHILSLLRRLKAPIVTTLHTILTDPHPEERAVMNDLVKLSDRLVVMSERSVSYLKNVYRVPENKIDLIPHGIPDVPFVKSTQYKSKFNLDGKQVLLTFGLLSPNKGIEYVIKALPDIVKNHPDVMYVILGTTHPQVRRHHGEAYRDSLQKLAIELGVEQNIIFDNQFVNLDELLEFIGASDIYITPYLSQSQIVSGTLAYTVGAGKAVISTPYWYAEELLADGRGLIVPFRDSQAITQNVNHLLDNPQELEAIQERAYRYGRNMVWPKIAQEYLKSFEQGLSGRIHNPHISIPSLPAGKPTLEELKRNLPPINLNHLLNMTDDLGIFQHAIFNLPNYFEGYTTDDNARALILVLHLSETDSESYVDYEALIGRYLAFLWYALNKKSGRFRNFLGFDRKWLEEAGSEDSHGRALWSLGAVISQTRSESLQGVAAKLFARALPLALNLTSPRSWAFSLLGIHDYLRRFAGDRAVKAIGETLAERLLNLYTQNRSDDWHWFEDYVTYNNATLPHALLLTSRWLDRQDMAQAGLESLQWLVDIQTDSDGIFNAIGSNGFYRRAGEKAVFDQQPIEASATVSACLEAYRNTDDVSWHREAQRAFEWFLGRNCLGMPLYDADTGGCFDGLRPGRVNQNQGAESTLAFLMALTEMYILQFSATDSNAPVFSFLLERRPSRD